MLLHFICYYGFDVCIFIDVSKNGLVRRIFLGHHPLSLSVAITNDSTTGIATALIHKLHLL